MDSHALDGLDDLREHLRQLAPDLGYVVVGRESPKWEQLARIAWSTDAVVAAGLADSPDDEDLPELVLSWVGDTLLGHAVRGVREVFRVRLFGPKGGSALKQMVVTAEALDDPAEPYPELPPSTVGPSPEELLAKREARLFDELHDGYRRLLDQYRAHGRSMSSDLANSRANVSTMFDAHVRREMAIVNEKKAAAEAAQAAAAQAENEGKGNDLIAATVQSITPLVMAGLNLPPEMGDFLKENPELVDAMKDPKARAKLADPQVKAILLDVLRSDA